MEKSNPITVDHVFEIFPSLLEDVQSSPSSRIKIVLKSNIDVDLPVQFVYNVSVCNELSGILFGAAILIGMYVFIVFDIIHRTFAAILASTMALATLAARNERPAVPEIMSWIDVETLMLLFSMMILVTIMAQTGFFDYCAVFAYKVNIFIFYNILYPAKFHGSL